MLILLAMRTTALLMSDIGIDIGSDIPCIHASVRKIGKQAIHTQIIVISHFRLRIGKTVTAGIVSEGPGALTSPVHAPSQSLRYCRNATIPYTNAPQPAGFG